MESTPRTRTAVIQLSDLPKMRARNTNHCTKCRKELKEGDAIIKKIRSSRSNEKGHSTHNYHEDCWKKMLY